MQRNRERNRGDARPWNRPGFIVAAALMAVIVVLAVTICIANPKRSDAVPASMTSVEPADRRSAPQRLNQSCDLPEPTGDSASSIRLTGVRWMYEGASTYPVSPVYGPHQTAPQGYRYCYQHSRGGALFAAANTISLTFRNEADSAAWNDYIVATGPYHDQQLTADGGQDSDGLRMTVTGFRILEYAGTSAKVDLQVSATTIDRAMILSIVFDLVWQRGDWRYSSQTSQPLSVTRASELARYTHWGES